MQKPGFWFIALARCERWVRGIYDGDSCMGERDSATIPNGVFMYYDVRPRPSTPSICTPKENERTAFEVLG